MIITPLNLGISLFGLAKLNDSQQALALAKTPVSITPPSQLYAALPQATGQVLGVVTTSDARPVIIEKYLAKHHSPLLPYAEDLLAASERYNVDYRLIMAIAQCESNLCKRSPAGSFNCWGFENGDTRFLSWEQALNQVAKTLREGYLDQGLETPE